MIFCSDTDGNDVTFVLKLIHLGFDHVEVDLGRLVRGDTVELPDVADAVWKSHCYLGLGRVG
jgi:hypothetical protein